MDLFFYKLQIRKKDEFDFLKALKSLKHMDLFFESLKSLKHMD